MSEDYDLAIRVTVTEEVDKNPRYSYSTRMPPNKEYIEMGDDFGSIKRLSESINCFLTSSGRTYIIQDDPEIEKGIKGESKISAPIIIRGMTLDEKRTLASLLN